MSCDQTTKAYETCLETFWDLMLDYDFRAKIYENFLDHQDQWKEKEFGFSEDPYDNFFDYLWKWDAELVRESVKKAVSYYLGELSMKRWLDSGGTND